MQMLKRLLCVVCCIAISWGTVVLAETTTAAVTPVTAEEATLSPTTSATQAPPTAPVATTSGTAFTAVPTAEASVYTNPLLNPNTLTEYTTLPENMLNILLLGIDFGHDGYWGSGHKTALEDCHTDAVLVISVHLDTKKIDFISLPRDTLTYVPGIRGIYKLNAAFNCGTTVEDGLYRASQAASWVLGGIKIDEYCAVDMNMMEKLGDAMGGIDFDLEMSYRGHSGTRYYKGLHHLDGTGIMDYLRSRTNATVKSNDIGRTGRQRALMIAIFEKLKQDPTLLWKVIQTALDNTDGFFTSEGINGASLLSTIPFLLGLNEQDIGSYVITGKYRTALKGWNFTFTDQENRQKVIKEVYGIDVSPLPYVDYDYAKWLVDSGFHTIHILSVANELNAFLATLEEKDMNAENLTLIQTFQTNYTDTQNAFEAAALSMNKEDTKSMLAARKALQKAGDAVAEALQYPDKLPWSTGKYWYRDPYINEIMLDWR